MNAPEASDLVTTARSRRLFLMQAMWIRFLPHVIEIRRLLEAAALGRVGTVIADHGPVRARPGDARLFATELGGGALLDLGVHPVSFASMVLGTTHRIESLIEPTSTGAVSQTSMLLGYASGAQAILTCTSAAVSPTRASIEGTQPRIDIECRATHPAASP